MMGAMELGHSAKGEGGVSLTDAPPGPGGKIRYFGDYELLEEIARGGMGVVYKARQMSLGRLVALKMILPGRLASPEMVRRFRTEAEAAAKLDHPNIVPIYEIGEHEGQHYFSMKLIEGPSLAQCLPGDVIVTGESGKAKGTSTFRKRHEEAVKLLAKVARAVHYAHQRGILHRDLKPENILLGSMGEPYVTDFGLAKLLDQDAGQTQSTIMVGTPSYMAPEQATRRSKDLTTAADVYSLGAILYVLLAGRPPFKADTPLQTLHKVVTEEPVSLRQVNPGVDRDLERICLKSLDKDNQRRFGSAEAFAEDLERWLEGKPVSARPVGQMERTWRWCRRNPALAGSLGGAVFLLVAGVVASRWQAVRAIQAEERAQAEAVKNLQLATDANEQKRLAEEALEEARAQRKVAETARDEAKNQKEEKEKALKDSEAQRIIAMEESLVAQEERIKTEDALKSATQAEAKAKDALEDSRVQQAKLETNMDFMLFDLSEKLRPIGRVDVLRSVTDKVLEHYQSLPQDDTSDDSLARRFAAFKNLGQVLAIQGDSAQAAQAYRTSLDLAKTLFARHPDKTSWQGELSICHQRIGESWEASGDSGKALEEYQMSLSMAQRLAERDPGNPQWQACALASYLKVGDVLRIQADKTKALVAYQNALETARSLVRVNPDNARWQRDLSVCYRKVGSLLLEEQGPDAALGYCTNGLLIARQFAAKEPGNAQWQSDLAASYDTLGDVVLARKETQKALDHYEEARIIRDRMAKTDSDNTEWQRDLLRSFFRIIRALSYESKKTKRLELFREALKVMVLVDYAKNNIEFVQRLFSTGDGSKETLGAFQESMQVAQGLADKDPGNTHWQDDLATGYSLLGDMLLRAGENESALPEYRKALRIRQQRVSGDTNATDLQYKLVHSYSQVAVALWRLSRREQAMVEAMNGLGIIEALVARWPKNFVFWEVPPNGEKNMRGKIPLSPNQLDDLGAILRWGQSAVKREARNVTDPMRQEQWGSVCSMIAMVYLLAGNITEAMVHAQHAVGVWESLSQTSPTNLLYKARLAHAYVGLAAFQLWNRQSPAAINTTLRGLQLDPAMVEFKAILAMACFCSGQYERARAVLRENKDLQVGPNQSFPEAVLDDLRRFHDRGLPIPNPGELEALLATDPARAFHEPLNVER
jgi:tetratricopeptide (TPR) repeat protein